MAYAESMFHQVRATPEDRDSLHFLWFENNTSQPLQTLRMTAHIFGGVWTPSCANYALKMVVEEYRNMYSEEVLNKLLKHILKEDRGKSLIYLQLNLEDQSTERALGMLWHVNTDYLGFDVQVMHNRTKTKRNVLSTLSTVFDPLGYVSSFILQARIFQQLCRLQKGWNEPLPIELEEQWGRWLADLPEIKRFKVPRCFNPTALTIKMAQLHHFSDASENGYGVATYLRVTLEDNSVYINLIMDKSHLAPLKGSTIIRLELAGALEAVRLDKILTKELEIPLEISVYWVDSQIILWYLNSSDKRFQTYVANRVGKILDNTVVSQWRYVPSEENPGDDASLLRQYTSKWQTFLNLML
nr:uncharacterized protein LOC113802859 [Penaeus vannamei]